jgi:hypothetical protein
MTLGALLMTRESSVSGAAVLSTTYGHHLLPRNFDIHATGLNDMCWL